MQGQSKTYIKKMIMTFILILANAIVFIVTSIIGNPEYSESMVQLGGMFYPSVMAGEYYRFLTAMFLHFDGAHLIRNMFSLYALGSIIEPAFGKIRFLVIYLVSGLGGGIASFFYHYLTHRLVVSAGASGAIFGLAGALICLGLFNEAEKYGVSSRRILPAIIISVILSTSESTDVSAHLGGLFTGLIVAVIMILIRRHKN